MPDGTTLTDRALTISQSAAKHVQKLIASEGDDNLMLRIAVSGGGCSGFQYGFSLDTDTGQDDLIFEGHGAKVVIDDMSLDLLAGSEVDYVEDLIGSYFSIKNPNASSTCGCGSSFAV
ncbi:iron-sulfur cluster insertion protein ErpA [Alphaproteobacteria bacterium HT1-32]|nr:iron-sulfur cluster insertion protein ErpA [Alphaproteobacteria bacterium HT1-32]|tara:strand:+ start:130 stop:483 length:354 start_codon:yes stop_codon:yes gene_type:complete